MIAESTQVCLTLESVIDRPNSSRWTFSHSTVEEGFRNLFIYLFIPLPGQMMKALRSTIPVQISPLLGKRIGNKDSENQDKGWKTRGKVQAISKQGLLFLRSPAAWNTWEFYHQRWVRLHHVPSQSLCLSAGGKVREGDSGQLSPPQSSDSGTFKMERVRLALTWTDNSIVQCMGG